MSGRLTEREWQILSGYANGTVPHPSREAVKRMCEDYAALRTRAEQAERERDNLQFEMQGLDLVRRKDNAYLIAQRDTLWADLQEARGIVQLLLGSALMEANGHDWRICEQPSCALARAFLSRIAPKAGEETR